MLGAAVGLPTSATAQSDDGIDWSVAYWSRGVQQTLSEPSGTDQHVHARFKRTGGDGRRLVRIVERHWRPKTQDHSPWRYSRTVDLQVGQEVVLTTKAALKCEPDTTPIAIRTQMRVKLPGQPWAPWQTWQTASWYLLEC